MARIKKEEANTLKNEDILIADFFHCLSLSLSVARTSTLPRPILIESEPALIRIIIADAAFSGAWRLYTNGQQKKKKPYDLGQIFYFLFPQE